jgi:hypothetical protein
MIILTATNSQTKFSIYFINSIFARLNYVVILTNPLVVAYYSFMSIGELEMGFTDAELCNFRYFIYPMSILVIIIKKTSILHVKSTIWKNSRISIYIIFAFAVLDHNWARLVKSTDLSTLKVDYLSDSDIAKIKAKQNE